MKTEKIIRSQAKESLKGNWTAAVSGVFVLLGALILLVIFYSMLLSLTGIISGDELKSGSETALIIILSSTFILAFALSPFKNGYFRLCYNIATDRSDGLRDIFYFFSGIKLYFKALQFNIIIMLKRILFSVIGFIPYILFATIKYLLFLTATDGMTKQFFDTSEAVIICLCVTITIIISIRLFIPEFVFVDNYEANVFSISNVITKKHLKDYYRLVSTFLFWILLCFFVLPGLYVIPYFTTSLGTTSKWLINLYKEGKTV